MPFTFKLSKRLARLKASFVTTGLPALAPAAVAPTILAVLLVPKSIRYAVPRTVARSRGIRHVGRALSSNRLA